MRDQKASNEARVDAARAPRRRRRAEAIIAEYIREISGRRPAVTAPRVAVEEAE
jgi:hypothetical protein